MVGSLEEGERVEEEAGGGTCMGSRSKDRDKDKDRGKDKGRRRWGQGRGWWVLGRWGAPGAGSSWRRCGAGRARRLCLRAGGRIP